MRFTVLFFFASFLCSEVFAQSASSRQICGSGGFAGSAYRWCADLPGASRSHDVLYYLHGNGGDERAWATPDHQTLQSAWGTNAPVVVTVSFGPTWFFNSQSLSLYTSRVIPEIEARLGLKPSARLLMGESMGGFNALQVYFAQPSMFARFVAGCPAVLSFSPFASDAEVEAYIRRHQPYVIPKLVYKWRDKLRSAYPSPMAWAAHDPVGLAAQASSRSPEIFVYADGADAFGFQEGARAVEAGLSAHRAPLEAHFVTGGGHCRLDVATLSAMARFLVPAKAIETM